MSERTHHQERHLVMKRVTVVGVVVNFFLAIIQILIGFISYSSALVADGIHTLSDLIGDFAVLVAAKEANKRADRDHPYGHGRIETLVTVILGVILIFVGLFIGIRAIVKLIDISSIVQPDSFAILAAILAIVFKEGLFHYTLKVAKQTNSRMLEANAWHHRSDVFSSIIVLVGIVAAVSGYIYMDVLAAFLVAMLISRMGVKMSWESIQELIDTSLEQEKVESIKREIACVEGVRSLHMLRTRRMGGYALADVHIQVDPRLSVSEGHQISESVRQNLINSVQELDDVTVHIDPEDDENAFTCLKLPLRNSFLNELYPVIAPAISKEQIEEITIHYLNGKIDIDIHINDDCIDAEQVKSLAQTIEYIGSVYCCCRI